MTHTHDDPYESARNCQACYNPPTNPVRVTYDVRVVGHTWEGFTAAMSYIVDVDRLPEFTRCDDETDTDYETRMVQCATETGDFASVDAWEIERHEHETTRLLAGTLARHETYRETIWKDRYVTLCKFDHDDENTYNDCVFGMVDDDDYVIP